MRARRSDRADLGLALGVALALLSHGCESRSSSVTAQSAIACAAPCTAPDACHQPGVCDRISGECSAPTPVDCGPNHVCDLADGQCHDLCAFVTCIASDGCHLRACDPTTGSCGAQTEKLCEPGYTCDPGSGQCKSNDPCSGVTCAAGLMCNPTSGQCVDLCAGVVCIAPDLCHATTCDPRTGTCSPATAIQCSAPLQCIASIGCVDLCAGNTCSSSGQECDPSNGQCYTPQLQVLAAKGLGLEPPAAIAFGADGALYVVGTLDPPPTQVFDTFSLISYGQEDLFVARYDAAPTWSASWAVHYGDTSLQFGSGVAVTQDGTVAVLGTFLGSFAIGSALSNSGNAIDFLAGLNADGTAAGTGKWAKQFNDGFGQLLAVAANPSDYSAHGNRIAVCGYANSGTPSDFVGAGATAAAGNDILIGVFDTSGNKVWAIQVATAANEDCEAITVDDNGDVIAAGTFSGASLNFGGSTSALIGPNASTRSFLWVAKFSGATGTAIASVAFGGTTGTVTPASLTTDAADDVIVGGGFTGNVTVGATTLASAGQTDGYVAKLSSALAADWAVRIGGLGADAVAGVGVDSSGDVIATGRFNKKTTGAWVLTSSSSTSFNPFVMKLTGATGVAAFATAFGDATMATGDAVAVNRYGADELAVAGSYLGPITFPAAVEPLPVPTNASSGSGGSEFLLFATFAK